LARDDQLAQDQVDHGDQRQGEQESDDAEQLSAGDRADDRRGRCVLYTNTSPRDSS
jgi:hypothetical protein